MLRPDLLKEKGCLLCLVLNAYAVQMHGMKVYAPITETEQKAQSLMKYKWAKAIWQTDLNDDARKMYLKLVMERRLML